jgi:hypothetical protein
MPVDQETVNEETVNLGPLWLPDRMQGSVVSMLLLLNCCTDLPMGPAGWEAKQSIPMGQCQSVYLYLNSFLSVESYEALRNKLLNCFKKS